MGLFTKSRNKNQYTRARDLGVLVERGDIAGCSFGFRVPKDGDHWEMRAGQLTRDLVTVDLHEITITGNPAYLDTSVAKRSMDLWRKKEYFDSIGLYHVTLEAYK